MTDHAIRNAKSWMESIREMVARLKDDEKDVREAAREEIEQSALSVLVRGGWHNVGEAEDGADEFEILLTTGGPALRIYGTLGAFAVPQDFELQYQDWGTPWTDYLDGDEDDDAALRTFVECFYFGDA